MQNEAARILVVDDEESITQLVSTVLRYEGFEVECAAGGRAAVKLTDRFRPDLIVLDVMLPDLDGFEVYRRLSATEPRVPVLFLTAKDQPADRVHGLTLGADDYVGKPFGVKELLARVRVQLRRPRASARHLDEVRVGEVTLDLRLRRAHCGRRPLDLSSREFELLEYLLDHADRVVTREELLRAVWGYSAAPLTRTVDNFVAKLRKKVEPDPRNPRHILTVHGSGYRLVRFVDEGLPA